jgi:prepilin-type N-terminal cleavage/methylation domain-containing protein
MKHPGTNSNAFTLLEILFVLAVMAIIAAGVFPSIRGIQSDAKITQSQSDLNVLKAAVESYRRHHDGALPDNISTALMQTSPKLLSDVLNDPWQTAPDLRAKSGYTYAYVTADISGFGLMYAIYSQGIHYNGNVTWDASLTTNLRVTANNSAIAVSNAPVR